jgi:chemotaxis protein methyltransferase CheR
MALPSQPAAGAVAARGTAAAAPGMYISRIRDLIYSEAGIFYPDTKLHTLEERCTGRMKEIGVVALSAYCQKLTNTSSRRSEITELLNRITVGETCFFRNQPQLDALRKVVLPKIVAAHGTSGTRHIRIWSAGCSTGEEPYTLAMILLEEKQNLLKGFNFEVLATDLNEISLDQARKGAYGDYSTRNLAPHFRQTYFHESDGSLQVNAAVQSVVKFSRVNLQDQDCMARMKNMDVILCCNVLIYFDIASKRTVIQHFYNDLLPHGYFFLGYSESLYGINDDFRLVHMPSATAYAKSEAVMGGRGQS